MTAVVKHICQQCGRRFTPKQFYQRFCTALCRLRAFRARKKEKGQKP